MISESEIGENIAVWRQRRALTQAEMARLLGTSRSAVNNWENGYASISASQVVAVSAVLDVSVACLLGEDRQVDPIAADVLRLFERLDEPGREAVRSVALAVARRRVA